MPGATYAASISHGLIPNTKRLDARWLLIIFFLAAALQQAARSSRAWLLDPAANFAAASWRQAANRAAIIFFPCCRWLLDTGLGLFPRNKKAPAEAGADLLGFSGKIRSEHTQVAQSIAKRIQAWGIHQSRMSIHPQGQYPEPWLMPQRKA